MYIPVMETRDIHDEWSIVQHKCLDGMCCELVDTQIYTKHRILG